MRRQHEDLSVISQNFLLLTSLIPIRLISHNFSGHVIATRKSLRHRLRILTDVFGTVSIKTSAIYQLFCTLADYQFLGQV